MTKTLPLGAARVIKALVHVLVPPVPELADEGIEETVVRDVGRILFEFQKFFRWGFILGLALFEWLPFLSGFGFVRFSSLSPENRARYVAEWAESRLLPKREFFKGVKGIVIMIYFSDRRVWSYINYDPVPHMEEKIQLRQDILARTERVL